MSIYTQPALLWALIEDYARRTEEEGPYSRTSGPHDYEVSLFRRDQPGAWLMHSAKLYWTDEPGGQYFANCPQDALSDNEDHIGEVVLFRRRTRRTEILGTGLDSAVLKLTSKP